jgi:hypothetical protein
MKRSYFVSISPFLAVGFFFLSVHPVPSVQERAMVASPINAQVNSKVQVKVVDKYDKLPLIFEENRGQTDRRVKFLSRLPGYELFLTNDEAVLALYGNVNKQWPKIDAAGHARRRNTPDPEPEGVLQMKLHNANPPASLIGLDEVAGRSNYFIGNDPRNWRTNILNYAKVQYKEVYPGIDLVYHGSEQQLEYDFIIAPGGDPGRIAFDILGAKQILRDKQGDLLFKVGGREIRWHRPVVYQKEKEDGAPEEIAADYAITGKDRVSFELAKYDATRPLYIDPIIYSTYLGGSNTDVGSAIAVDSSGNVYVTGRTISTDFPTTTGAYQTSCNGGSSCSQDAFVTKMNATGTALVYSTYLGGSAADAGAAITLDSSGNAYITGQTSSTDFPTTSGAFRTTGNSAGGAFVTELDPAGSALVYSTYLVGSTGSSGATGIAVDRAGRAYVTGDTTSGPHIADDFPTTPGAFQTTCYNACVFVTEFNPTGTALVYSTYLGAGILLSSIAVDGSGSAYVTGYTISGTVPTTPGAFQTTCVGVEDAFVTKFNATGTALVYSTFLCSPKEGGGSGITVDNSGNAYVTGFAGDGFPTTPGAFQTTCPDLGVPLCLAAFVTEVNPAGSALVYSSYLGGSGSDGGSSIAVDSSGNAFVTGTAYSTYFPTTPGAFQTSLDGPSDAFLAVVNPSGSALYYSTYLGGGAADSGNGIAVDSSHNAYVTGTTSSTDFPTTTGVFQATCTGCKQYSDAFVSKFNFDQSVSAFLAPANLTFGNQIASSTSPPQTFTLSSNGIELPLSITSIQVTGPNAGDFAEVNNCSSSLPSTGNCTINVTFTPTGGGTRTAAVTVTDNAPNSPQTVSLSGAGQDFSIVSSGSSPATVSPGQIANYTLTIAPVGAFAQNLALTCNGAPTQSTCIIPSSVALNSSASKTVPVSVVTTGPSAALASPNFPSAGRPAIWFASCGFLGFMILSTVVTKWRNRSRRLSYVLAFLCLISLGITSLACGGNSSSNGRNGGGTPAGSYNLTVSGTFSSASTTLTHNVKLTLVVQ